MKVLKCGKVSVTFYLAPELARALRMRAASEGRSVTSIVAAMVAREMGSTF